MFNTERSRYTAITMLANPLAVLLAVFLYALLTSRFSAGWFTAAIAWGMLLITVDYFIYVRNGGKTWLMGVMGYRDGEPDLLAVPPKKVKSG